MAEVSQEVGLILCIGSMCCWGSWPYLRMQCTLQGPSFTILYFCGQFIAALFLSLSIGGAANLQREFALQPRDSWRVACIVFGGCCVGNADFLCSLAMAHVHFSIAYPVYAGLALALGSSLVYCIDGQGKAPLLFSGVALAILAICCLAAAEAAEVSPSSSTANNQSGAVPSPVGCPPGSTSGLSTTFSPLQPQLSDEGNDETRFKEGGYEKKEDGSAYVPLSPARSTSKGWVNVCIFCGMLGGLWSPLSSLGRLEGGVDNPLTGLIIFQLGQLCCVPLQCCYYSIVMLLLEGRDSYVKSNDPAIFLREISASCRVSFKDTALALCTGAIVGTGFTLYFIASVVVNPTVALAIPSCEPLVTIVFGVLVSRKLHHASQAVRLYYLLAFSLFIAAITLLSVSI